MNSFEIQRVWKFWRNRFFLQALLLLAFLVVMMIVVMPAMAQEGYHWSTQRTVPDFHLETDPPILIADQNKTVHVFSSQWLGEDDGQSVEAVVYNHWTSESGWTVPVDILLSPLKNEARILDAFLDQNGMMHLIFFGGDNTEANIYYSKAPAADAGRASAWSKPILVGLRAHDPENGGLASDGKGNLLIVYGGDQHGVGWYVATSSDNGNTWSEADLFFPVYNSEYSPYWYNKHIDESGLLHAVWSVQDKNNLGEAVYYANYDFVTMQWSEPLQLATQRGGKTGLGTMQPIIIEHQDSLILVYYDGFTNQQYMRLSSDGGRNWTESVAPFPQIGLNGSGDFIVDSNGELHLFWAQRLAGSPNTHGVWHSTWQETGWSDFEAAVSRSGVGDNTGPENFDPNGSRVAISSDSWFLVVWRTDYLYPGNGIWYTTKKLDAPELPVVSLPTIPSALVVEVGAENITKTPEPTREAIPEFYDEADLPEVSAINPSESLFTGLIPVTLLILFIVVFRQLSQSRRR